MRSLEHQGDVGGEEPTPPDRFSSRFYNKKGQKIPSPFQPFNHQHHPSAPVSIHTRSWRKKGGPFSIRMELKHTHIVSGGEKGGCAVSCVALVHKPVCAGLKISCELSCVTALGS